MISDYWCPGIFKPCLIISQKQMTCRNMTISIDTNANVKKYIFSSHAWRYHKQKIIKIVQKLNNISEYNNNKYADN